MLAGHVSRPFSSPVFRYEENEKRLFSFIFRSYLASNEMLFPRLASVAWQHFDTSTPLKQREPGCQNG